MNITAFICKIFRTWSDSKDCSITTINLNESKLAIMKIKYCSNLEFILDSNT